MVTQFIEGVDAAGDVAAVGNQVALLWGAGALSSEESRTVYARFSDDGGVSFGPELQVGNRDIGACACCSLAAEFDTRGPFGARRRWSSYAIAHPAFLGGKLGRVRLGSSR